MQAKERQIRNRKKKEKSYDKDKILQSILDEMKKKHETEKREELERLKKRIAELKKDLRIVMPIEI